MTCKDRTVVITGAAGGIGSKLAETYAGLGYGVLLTDADAVKGEDARGAVTERTGNERAAFFRADLRRPLEIDALFAFAKETFGTVDILVNNAGFGITKSPFELDIDEWDSVLQTNLRGTFLCSREAAKLMRERRCGGRIVNIASTRAMMSEKHTEAYAASKGGIVALTHAMAVSLGPDGITVNCISPGWIETDEYGALREIDHKQHPSGRVGEPGDIARACLYLTDPANDFVTGVNLVVDGGMTRKMNYEE